MKGRIAISGSRPNGRRWGSMILLLTLAACSGGSTGPGPGPGPGPDPDPIPPPPVPRGARDLGTVSDVGSATPCGPGASCLPFTVTCPGVTQDVSGRLQVEGPFDEAGTVLLFSGSGGRALWDEGGAAPRAAMADLHAAGFRTIQVTWDTGWFLGTRPDEGPAALACRPATVAFWIHASSGLHRRTGAYCASGNSGGAAQVSYMLSHYGLENILDLVVPTEGPPMAELDSGCVPSGPEEAAFQYSPDVAGAIDQSFGFQQNGPCARSDPAFLDRFREESVVSPDADFAHPATAVRFLLGQGGGPIRAHSRAYFQRLVEEGVTDVLLQEFSGVGHAFQTVPTGADAIRDVILAECRPR